MFLFTILVFVTSLSGVSLSLICLIISLICLAIAAFIGPPTSQPVPFYNRINWGWAGVFFFVLATALS